MAQRKLNVSVRTEKDSCIGLLQDVTMDEKINLLRL